MESSEIQKQLSLSYKELVEYLLSKYGPCLYNYFSTTSCASHNSKVKRTKEGLFVHHIDEDKAILLSTKEYAKKNPFSYQQADRLVYCNVLEHLVLHIKIVEEPIHPNANEGERPGIGGIYHYILPEINSFFNGVQLEEWKTPIYEIIKDNFDDYIYVLKYFLEIIDKRDDLTNANNLYSVSYSSYMPYKKNIAERVFLSVNNLDLFCIENKKDLNKETLVFNRYNDPSEIEDSTILYCLGYCYFYGLGTEENADYSFNFFKESASRENSKAKEFLDEWDTVLLRKQRRKETIIKFNNIKKNAKLGDIKAQFELAQFYELGLAIKSNNLNAIKWYKKAAESGHAKSQWYLGFHYEYGECGLKKNIKESLKWFKLAADQGYAKEEYERLLKQYSETEKSSAYKL